MTWMDKLGGLLQDSEGALANPANLANQSQAEEQCEASALANPANLANQDSQGTPATTPISQVSQISQAEEARQGATPASSISQVSQISHPSSAEEVQGGGVDALASISRISQISQPAVDVDAVLEEAVQGTEVSAALLKAFLTAEDLEAIRRGGETASTLHGVAWLLPNTPGCWQQAQERLAEQQEPEATEEQEQARQLAGTTADDLARACRAFYRHIEGSSCCNPPYGRYCPEGQRLKTAYERADQACEAPLAERLEARMQQQKGER